MDDARLAEIEATAHSPAYQSEADVIGVDELIAEIKRLKAAVNEAYENGISFAQADVVDILGEALDDIDALAQIKHLVGWTAEDD